MKRIWSAVKEVWRPALNLTLGFVIGLAVAAMLKRGPGSEFLWGIMFSIAGLGVVMAWLACCER